MCVKGVYKLYQTRTKEGTNKKKEQEERTGEQATGKGYSHRAIIGIHRVIRGIPS